MLLAALCIAPVLFQQPEVKRITSLTGNIAHVKDFESKILGNKRNLIVYLPPDYGMNPKRRYPVLYCHDGQNIFDGATSYIPNKEWRIDEAAQALILAGLIEPIIIVGIENAGMARADEYLPTRFKWNNREIGGKADRYSRFLFEEVKSYIDRTYRTKPGGRDTAMLGSSLGGVVTYYLGIEHPDKVSRLALVSPSVWVNDRELIKRTNALKGKPKVRMWIDMGTAEGLNATRDAKDLFNALSAKGMATGKDLVYYEDGFAEHNEEAWARRIPAILIWMFGVKR